MQFGVSESIYHWGQYRPNHTAISSNGVSYTYLEFNNLVNRLCLELSKRNIEAERIAITVKSKLHLMVSIVSVLRLGKSPVILNIGLPKDCLKVNIEDTGSSLLLYDSTHKELTTYLYSTVRDNYAIKISELIRSEDKKIKNTFKPNAFRRPEDEWGIVFSSGTTGIPKGIERDHNSIVTELLGWCLELGLNRETSFYIGRPVYYTGGLVLALSTLLTCGHIIINDFNDSNSAEEVWDDYQETIKKHESVKWAFFIPDQIRKFVRISNNRHKKPFKAESILTMGHPITAKEKQDAVNFLGSKIVESWGNSESLGTITDPEDVERRPNSIGRPFLTDEMCIVDESGQVLPPETYGRIAGSEEAGFNKYSNRPEESKRIKRNNLIISEDIGYTDKEGFFYVKGRIQDCIVIDNKIYFLPDIESKLYTIDCIKECCLILHNEGSNDSKIIAIVALEENTPKTKNEIIEETKSHLQDTDIIDNFIFVDVIPRLPSGKIDKVSLSKSIEVKE